MGFIKNDFQKAFDKISKMLTKKKTANELSKQAGNSIVKPVLMAIFGQMIPGKENVYKEVNENANT